MKPIEVVKNIDSVDEHPFNEKHKICFKLAKKGLSSPKIGKILNYHPTHVMSVLSNMAYKIEKWGDSDGMEFLSGRAINQLTARGIKGRKEAVKALEKGEFHIGLPNVGSVVMREILLWAYDSSAE